MNPYQVNTSEMNLYAPIVALTVLYDGMPQTTGCERCREANGDDAIWCCRTQSPSLYYIEFLKAWQGIQKWKRIKRAELVVRAIVTYLESKTNKGCVFYNGDECTIYPDRPLVCRLYGVMPQVSWDKRWEALKEREGEQFDARSQCDLVSTISGEPITPVQEKKWFGHVRKCEERIGVSNLALALHDETGGSYRAPHDHLLLELFPPEVLNRLTQVRVSKPSKEDIEATAELMRQKLIEAEVI